MENEEEFRDVLNTLIPVLNECEKPISVSHLNVQFNGLFQIKNAIDQRFMESFRDRFRFFVLGDDIKIKLCESCPNTIEEGYNNENALILKKVLYKDIKKIDDIKRKLKSEMKFSQFIKDFSSGGRSVNLSFILRNSHELRLYLNGEDTYVNLVGTNTEEINEEEFWHYLTHGKGLENFILERLLNVFRKFKTSLEQGKLQCCFKIGDVSIDKTFMIKYGKFFDKEGETLFFLKDEYRITTDHTYEKNSNFEIENDTPANTFHDHNKGNSEVKETHIDKVEDTISNDIVPDANEISEVTEKESICGDDINIIEINIYTDDEADEEELSSSSTSVEKDLKIALKSSKSVVMLKNSGDQNTVIINLTNNGPKKREQLLNIRDALDKLLFELNRK